MRTRRIPVLLVWAVLLVGLGVAAGLRFPVAVEPSEPSTPAGTALDRLADRIPGAADATGWVVLVAPDGASVDDPASVAATTALVTGLRSLPGVTAVVDPSAGGTVSADRQIAFVPVAVGPDADPSSSALDHLVDGARAAGLRVELGGALAAVDSARPALLLLAVAVGLLAALGLAGWVLGSVVGGVLAAGTALVGSGVGTAGAVLVAGPLGLTAAGTVLIFLAGVAVGLPGAVVLLGSGSATSVRTVISGSGSAAVAAAALAVTGIAAAAVVGVAVAGVIAVVLAAELTLLPALRGLAGPRPPSVDDSAGEFAGGWARWVRDHPARAVSASLVLLAVLIAGSTVAGTAGTAPRPVGPAEQLLASAFGAGVTGPLVLTVQVDAPERMAAALPAVAAAARGTDGVALAAPGRVSADGTLGVVTVVPTTGPDDPATRDLVHRLREQAYGDATVEVTGSTAVAIEVADAIAAAFVRLLLVLAGLATVLLFGLVRPWPVAAVSLVGAGLSVGASLLLARAVASWTGWPPGWDRTPGDDAIAPVVAVALLVGLVLDQAVRASGRWARPTRMIGGCAMVVAAGLVGALAGPTLLAGTASVLVIGVLLDAAAVRLTLLPAARLLLGGSPGRPAGAHEAGRGARPDGVASGGAGDDSGGEGRRLIEQALAAPEPRRGGRHRGG